MNSKYFTEALGVLSDEQIQYLTLQHNMIEPFYDRQIDDGVVSYGVSSMGYDMRAGFDWKVFLPERVWLGDVLDPKKPKGGYFKSVHAEQGERVIIPANGYALTHSLEYLRMPSNVIGICVGKSTYARVGIHVNVTPIEPGWEGQITIEISNATQLPVAVYAGEGIMQLVFFAGAMPRVSYADRNGKYQGQVGVTLAKAKRDL